MRKIFTLLLVIVSLFSYSQSTTLVISQFYGAGGNTGATLNADYVELHNVSTVAQSTAGLTIQYASATNTTAWTGVSPLPSASIPAGGYYLIQMGSAGANGAALPTPDYLANPTISMSGTSGKVALVNSLTALTGCPVPSATVIDMVGYGTANCFETAATAVLTATAGGIRNNNGCAETDNNGADFTVATPAPRNSASPVFICSGSTSPSLTAGTVVDFGNVVIATNSTSQSFNVSGTNLTGAPGTITITAPSTDFQVSNDNTAWGASTTIPYSAAALATTPVYVRFTPQTVGPKTGNVTILGGGVTTAVNVAVSGNGILPVGPSVTFTPSSVTGFGAICPNTTAGPNSFTINGANLTAANLVVGPLAGYTFSTTSGGTYTASLTLTQPGGSYTQDIFVQFTPTAAGSYDGNISVTGGGLSAAASIAVTGSGSNGLATVVTGSPSAITQVSATLSGTLPAQGCSPVTAYGFEYSLTSGFTPGTGIVATSSNLAGIDFSAGLTGLTLGTTYYYIAYATNAAGTVYGTQSSFITSTPPAPTVLTTALTGFGNVCLNTTAGPNSFTINATNLTVADLVVGPLAGYTFSTTSGGTYSATLTLTHPAGTYTQDVFVQFTPTSAISYDGSITVTGGGLAAASTTAVTGSGIAGVATVVTGSASAITQSTATLSGTLPAQGCSPVTVYGFEYSLTSGFTPGTGIVASSTNLAGTAFSANLTGLTPATNYYYIAFATNAGGTVYGSQLSFITSTPPPASLTATSLTAFGATCVGTTVGPNSFDITGNNLTTANVTVGPLNGYTFSTAAAGPYTNSLSLTQPGGAYTKTIYVQFNPPALGSYNGNIPVIGGGASNLNVPVSGTGNNNIAAVITGNAVVPNNVNAANNISASGSITDLGCSPVFSYGIEYSGVNGFIDGTGIRVPSTNLSGTDFSSLLTGLVQSTTYYYKAYAENNGGIAYGQQNSFTTGSLPEGLVIYNVPIVRGQNLHYSVNGLKAGHYSTRIFNYVGQLVYQQDFVIQVDFMDKNLIVPAQFPLGAYTLEVRNPDFKIVKSFLVQ